MTSRRLVLLLVVGLFALALAACGGPSDAPDGIGVRPDDGGAASGAEGTATPDAPSTPTPTPTLARAAPTPTPTPSRVALSPVRANAAVAAAEDGLFEVAVWLDVAKVGLSGVDVTATALHPTVSIESIARGAALGGSTLVGFDQVDGDGGQARFAYARRGESAFTDVVGEVAVVRVRAEDADAIRNSLVVALRWTDAGLKLHGPVDAPLD